MKQRILRILPFITTALIMALIFFLSSQTREESAALSSGLTRKIIDLVMVHASEADKENYLKLFHDLIRKCAHFVLYASLGFSASGMFIKYKYRFMWLYSLILSAVYAVSDEFHQSLVAGRGPMIKDVVIDGCGAAFGAAVFVILIMIFRKGKRDD